MTVTQDDKPIVKEVERKDGKVLRVFIEYWPFQMTFVQRRRRTCLISFARFDGSRDEPGWIPPMYFQPAINIARGIFSSAKEKKTAQSQARLPL